MHLNISDEERDRVSEITNGIHHGYPTKDVEFLANLLQRVINAAEEEADYEREQNELL